MGKQMLYFTVILALFSVASAQLREPGELCELPANKGPGTCVPLNNCAVLADLLRPGHRTTEEERTTVRQHKCGEKYLGTKRIPLVCCSLEGVLPLRDCGKADPVRIFGGSEANLFEIPWITRLVFTDYRGEIYDCGGSIITNRHVITAAHCVSSRTPTSVRVGELNMQTDPDCNENKADRTLKVCAPPAYNAAVKNVTVHPDYDEITSDNDIAILDLLSPLTFSPSVRPVCLPIIDDPIAESKNMTVAGWGKTEPGKQATVASRILLKVDLPNVPPFACENAYRAAADVSITVNPEKQICFGGDFGKDSCNGDSGGPGTIFQNWVSGKPRIVQHGIVSYGLKQCATYRVPGVYTRVRGYLPWILSHVTVN